MQLIYIDSCTDIMYYCTHNLYIYTVPLCTQMYTAVQLDLTYTHLWCTHAYISCMAVCLHCSPVSVHLYCQLVLTNEIPCKITFMNRFNQSQLRFLGIAPHHKLNHSMLTTSFPRFMYSCTVLYRISLTVV